MSSNRRFLLLIFGVKLEEVRAAMTRIPGTSPSGRKTSASHRPIQAHAQDHGSREASMSAPRVSTHPQSGLASSGMIPNSAQSEPASSLIDYAQYMQPPNHFISLATHPKKTNLLCWNCGLEFSRVPRFIAFESARVAGFDQTDWTIGGNFCSWACAARYIQDNYDDPKKWALMQNLAVVRAQCDGVRIRMVQCAPDKIKMRSYSGSCGMSQQEYSDLVESLSTP